MGNDMLDRVIECSTNGLECLDKMVGQTPLIRLVLRCMGRDITIYAKAEMYNLSGSIKDRMALMILRRAIERGELEVGQTIVEATSGSSGIALAAAGSVIGCPVMIFMPEWMSAERKALLKSYGANVQLISRQQGGFLGAMKLAEEFAFKHGAFLPQQFSNEDNCRAHYEGTAPELAAQVEADSCKIGAFVAGVGTGGTVMGVGRFLKERDSNVDVHPIQPAQSPILTVARKVGTHRIQGMVDEFIPDIVNLRELDAVISVYDGDAILMAQMLCAQAGLGVGISSGANLVGAIKTALKRQDEKAVCTVLCDSNMRYLSTDLSKEEPARPGFITPLVELRSVKVIDCF
ncbi:MULTISPECIES: cysteine synthase family protein [Sphingomonadales]|uniref:PLP-dependent cysteine synthase family protein n=2 Tax=Alphaproteobacteria TaxID=28211 RepID=UPI003298BEEF